eukprot:CAMPEP_0174247882 /NCGR_PEP_ID=MMETSP0417-20130205/42798_1 /TAXON_ID=242541 /ORGANISM="Mayorella sp, Strain BSH-02190019" /LENGTH=284 /DNA_ID=CAMNT_0015327743 /DNA_START=222 /DNA_END=1073 /DNA_ORIENTATION=+
MTSTYKSLSFFDVAGHSFGAWDASLGVTFCVSLAIVFSLWGSLTSSAPLVASGWDLPRNSSDVSNELMYGAFLFGFGWALAGYCPGPAIIMAVVGNHAAVLFTAALFAGWHAAAAHQVGRIGLSDPNQLLVAFAIATGLYVSWTHPLVVGGTDLPFSPRNCVIGGVLVASGVCLNCKFNGKVTGLSGIFGYLVDPRPTDRLYRISFLSGFVVAAFFVSWYYPALLVSSLHTPKTWQSLFGGFAVGVGTKLGSGCTSGHGLCGVARRSPRSLVATAAFLGSAFLW